MIIAQPYRILISRAISRNAHYIKGVVLDAGCGRVRRYQDFFTYDKYITTDIDRESGADIICSVEKMDIPNSEIDSMICTGVLGDIYDPQVAVREFNRILKNGGHCLLTDNFASLMHNQPIDYFRFTNFYLEKVFVENGFEVIKSERVGGFFTMILQLKIEYIARKWGLYKRRFLGRVMSKCFYFFFLIADFLDRHDQSGTNKSCAIAWLLIAKKIEPI